MSALNTKLLRDIWRLRAQVLTIALVVASGIASYVSLQSAWSSLGNSRQTYEQRYRFADVFAHAERVPEAVGVRLQTLPGVVEVHTRIVERVRIPVPGLVDPATGRVISLPDEGNAPLNTVYLRAGRLPDPGHPDEIVLLASFAIEHGVPLGGSLEAVLNGQQRTLTVVGHGLSPEFILPMAEGDMAPDDKRFAVIWMRRMALAPLYDMEGAFNDVVMDIEATASIPAVLDAVDLELDPWGSAGAYGRDRQLSAHAVDTEMQQLETFATAVPAIFLAVAAFLLNVVLARLVQLQRPQIASLKALGYYDREVATHYLAMMLVITLIGTLIGLGVGSYLGAQMTALYARFYRFPILLFALDGGTVLRAVGVSSAAALVGALSTVRTVAMMPPAEAMRPEAPGQYRRSLLDRLGLTRLLSTSVRMVGREIARKPLRLGFSVLAIAMSAAIVMVGRFSYDSFTYMMDIQFNRAWREDVTVMFAQPVPLQTAREMTSIDGVIAADGVRAIGVRMHVNQRERDVAINLIEPDSWMREVWDIEVQRHGIGRDGLVVTGALGRVLGVDVGDDVLVERLDGRRDRHVLPIAAMVEEPFGLNAYLDAEVGRALLGESPVANLATLRVNTDQTESIDAALTALPNVVGILRKQGMIDRFNEQMGSMMFAMTLILTLLSATISVGVVYNNARISLSMRSRDLASLRVLGFTRGEIAGIFYGEMLIQIGLAIPLGLVLGRWMSESIASSMDPEIFRLPTVVSAATYLFAVMVLVGSGLVSALLVHQRLQSLDLIAVLKARE